MIASGQPAYPQRPPYFAHRFVRLLTKSAAAQEIGPEACWLLTIIAHQEDAKRYRGAVTYYNEQLLPLCGFGGKDRLVRARLKAVSAGWLHYDGGSKGIPAKYWVLIPDAYQDIEDGPMDETSDSFAVLKPDGNQDGNQDGKPICRPKTGRQPGRQSDGKRASSYPNPIPIPISCSELPSTAASEPDDTAREVDPFPCDGPIKTWTLPAAKLAEWQASFPHLDVVAEIRKARQWIIDNPGKRKTANGIVRFLSGWLSRSQDTGRGAKRADGNGNGTTASIYRDLTPIAKVTR
jgi:hypothetical protein